MLSQAQQTWHRKILLRSMYALLMGILVSCLGEFGLRLFTRSSRFRQYDSELGVSLIPNTKAPHRRGCFEGEVYINRWGMRDRDRSIEKDSHEFRIGLLGDSMLEGVHVKPKEVMNIRMERLLEDKGYRNMEVLNFGVAGYGTTQEALIYKTRVRQFHPDLVVLLFVTGNDIMNNSSTLQPKAYGIHTWYTPYYELSPGGGLAFRPVEARPLPKLQSFLERRSLLAYYLERTWFRFGFNTYRWEGIPISWGVFSDPLEAEWESAWLVTEKVLGLLNDAASKDGAKLVVLALPEFYEVDPNWREWMTKEVGKIPPAFMPNRSAERLRQIAQRQNITLGFLAPYVRAYRDRHNLQRPYFSLVCDPHYSELGHQVIGEAIVAKLEEFRLLPEVADNIRVAGGQLQESEKGFPLAKNSQDARRTQ